MALVFWGLARFFLRTGFSGYSTAVMFSVLLRWVARLALVGTVAYTALIVFKKPQSPLLGGLTAGVAGAFVTFPWSGKRYSSISK